MADHNWFPCHSFNSDKISSEEVRKQPPAPLKGNKTMEDEPCDLFNFSCLLPQDNTTDRSTHFDSQNSDEDVLMSRFFDIDEKMNSEEDSLLNPTNRLPAPRVQTCEEVKMRKDEETLKPIHYEEPSSPFINPAAFEETYIYQHNPYFYHTAEQSENMLQSLNNATAKEDEFKELPRKKTFDINQTSKDQEWTPKKIYQADKEEAAAPKIEKRDTDTTPETTHISDGTHSTMDSAPERSVSDKRPERNYLKLFVKGMQKMMARKKIGLFLHNWAGSDIVTKQDVLDSLKESYKATTSYHAFKASVFVGSEIRYTSSLLRQDVLKVAKLKLAQEFVMKDNYEWWVLNAFAPFVKSSAENENEKEKEEEKQREKQRKKETFLQKRELLCKKFLSCFQDPDAGFDV